MNSRSHVIVDPKGPIVGRLSSLFTRYIKTIIPVEKTTMPCWKWRLIAPASPHSKKLNTVFRTIRILHYNTHTPSCAFFVVLVERKTTRKYLGRCVCGCINYSCIFRKFHDFWKPTNPNFFLQGRLRRHHNRVKNFPKWTQNFDIRSNPSDPSTNRTPPIPRAWNLNFLSKSRRFM